MLILNDFIRFEYLARVLIWPGWVLINLSRTMVPILAILGFVSNILWAYFLGFIIDKGLKEIKKNT